MVPYGNLEAFRDALLTLSDKELRVQIGERAAALATEYFADQDTPRRLQDLLRDLGDGKPVADSITNYASVAG